MLSWYADPPAFGRIDKYAFPKADRVRGQPAHASMVPSTAMKLAATDQPCPLESAAKVPNAMVDKVLADGEWKIQSKAQEHDEPGISEQLPRFTVVVNPVREPSVQLGIREPPGSPLQSSCALLQCHRGERKRDAVGRGRIGRKNHNITVKSNSGVMGVNDHQQAEQVGLGVKSPLRRDRVSSPHVGRKIGALEWCPMSLTLVSEYGESAAQGYMHSRTSESRPRPEKAAPSWGLGDWDCEILFHGLPPLALGGGI
jgi:hypothetical protein